MFTNQSYKPGHYPSGGSNHKHHGHNHSGGFKGNNGNHKGNGNAGHNNGQHRPNPEYKKDISQVLCFKCNNKGHYATDCPEKKAAEAAKPNPFQKGQVNHINVEEVYDEPDAVIGTFLLNSCPALVLFDTGASHSFISRAFVNKHGLVVENIGSPIRVSSPGGEMLVTSGCRQLSLKIGKHQFPTDLIILETQGLDVIIGMDWMTRYAGIIDCANRTITLTTPEGSKINFRSTVLILLRGLVSVRSL